MATAPVRPWRPPENSADVNESFLTLKPAYLENSDEMPSVQICLPQAVRFNKNHRPAQRITATINEAFNGEGSIIEGRRTDSGMKGVARRLSVLLLAGPLIKPSKNGMIAAEAINDVNKKSALRRILKTAESAARIAEQIKAAATARRTAKKGADCNLRELLHLQSLQDKSDLHHLS